MPQFVLKTERTIQHEWKFSWQDGQQKAYCRLNAEFLVLPRDQLNKKAEEVLKDDDVSNLDEAFLVVGLKKLSGIEIEGADGQLLQGDDYLLAARKDPTLSYALAKKYMELMQKN